MQKEDPEYLRNQSRRHHAFLRRNRRGTNIFLGLWIVVFLGLSAVAFADCVGRIGWGYSWSDMWSFLEFAGFGACLWVFSTLIGKFVLSYVEHTYGPEPPA